MAVVGSLGKAEEPHRNLEEAECHLLEEAESHLLEEAGCRSPAEEDVLAASSSCVLPAVGL